MTQVDDQLDVVLGKWEHDTTELKKQRDELSERVRVLEGDLDRAREELKGERRVSAQLERLNNLNRDRAVTAETDLKAAREELATLKAQLTEEGEGHGELEHHDSRHRAASQPSESQSSRCGGDGVGVRGEAEEGGPRHLDGDIHTRCERDAGGRSDAIGTGEAQPDLRDRLTALEAELARLQPYVQHKFGCEISYCQFSYSPTNKCRQPDWSTDHAIDLGADRHSFVASACTCGLIPEDPSHGS